MHPAHLRCLRKRRAEGEPIAQLAECFEITEREVIEATIRNGHCAGPFPPTSRPIEDAEIRYFVDQLAAGKTRNAIATELCLSTARLVYALGKARANNV